MALLLSLFLGKPTTVADWDEDGDLKIFEPSGAKAGLATFLHRKCSYYRTEYTRDQELLDGNPELYADLEHLRYADAFFDHAFTSDVLEHVRRDEQALREIFRVLKPGGHYFMQVPFNRLPQTEIRVDVREDGDYFLMPPEYHPVNNLVYRVYGFDLVDKLRNIGFSVAYLRFERLNFGISDQDAIVCRKASFLDLSSVMRAVV